MIQFRWNWHHCTKPYKWQIKLPFGLLNRKSQVQKRHNSRPVEHLLVFQSLYSFWLLKELLVLCFFVGFSYGVFGDTLIETAIGHRRRVAMPVFYGFLAAAFLPYTRDGKKLRIAWEAYEVICPF